METNKKRETKLAEFVHKQRQILPHSIEDYELDDLSKQSGFSAEEIRDINEESENFWKRNDE